MSDRYTFITSIMNKETSEEFKEAIEDYKVLGIGEVVSFDCVSVNGGFYYHGSVRETTSECALVWYVKGFHCAVLDSLGVELNIRNK